jgi:archaellum component FlaC
VENKLETFETNLGALKQCLVEKDSYISNLENKPKDMDSKIEAQGLQIKTLESTTEENIKQIENFKEKYFM